MSDGVRLTPKARADLDRIAEAALRAWGAGYARAWLGTLFGRLAFLAGRPQAGVRRPDLGAGVVCFPHEGHTIYYLVAERGGIDVVAIMPSLADHPLGDID